MGVENGQDLERSNLVNFQREYMQILRAWENRNREEFNIAGSSEEIPETPPVPTICQNVWKKFAATYQKSSTRTNNNVTDSSQSEKRFRLKKRLFGKSDSQIHEDDGNQRLQKFDNPDEECVQNLIFNENDAINCNNNKTNDNIHRFSNTSLLLWCSISFVLTTIKLLCISSIIVLFFFILIISHKPTESIIVRNTQDLIYPIMRLLRLISLPVIKKFPSLTEFYEDSCLVGNPYFSLENVECWPCESVHQVMDFRDIRSPEEFLDTGMPFVVREGFTGNVSQDLFSVIYFQNEDLLSREQFESSLSQATSFKELQKNRTIFMNDDFHLKWKITRVTTARLLRHYFPKPFFIPRTTEVSVQHFLFMDQRKGKSYSLPLTEFSNVFAIHANGQRRIVLIPTFNCQDICRVVSVVLHSKDILFYNWLYWRPVSFPTESFNSTISSNLTLSMTYIGSFY